MENQSKLKEEITGWQEEMVAARLAKALEWAEAEEVEGNAEVEEGLAARKGHAYVLGVDTRCPTSQECPALR